jgi:hypothetical protein
VINLELCAYGCSCSRCQTKRATIITASRDAGISIPRNNPDYYRIVDSLWGSSWGKIKSELVVLLQENLHWFDMEKRSIAFPRGHSATPPQVSSQPVLFDYEMFMQSREAYSGPTWAPRNHTQHYHQMVRARRVSRVRQDPNNSFEKYSDESIGVFAKLYTEHKSMVEELQSIFNSKGKDKSILVEEEIGKEIANFSEVVRLVLKPTVVQNPRWQRELIHNRHVVPKPNFPRKIIYGEYHSKVLSPIIVGFQRSFGVEKTRKKAEIRSLRIEQYMKLGPDMPQMLAEAMADEILPQPQAAEIFRTGWHQNDVSNEVLTKLLHCLREKDNISQYMPNKRHISTEQKKTQDTFNIDFQTAKWMHENSEHGSLILAVLNDDIEFENAKMILSTGFQKYPDATNAIVAGNPIDTVAMMYGIDFETQSKEKAETLSNIQPTKMVEPQTKTNSEWSRELDD